MFIKSMGSEMQLCTGYNLALDICAALDLSFTF